MKEYIVPNKPGIKTSVHRLQRMVFLVSLNFALAGAWAGVPPLRGLEEVNHKQVELRGGFWGLRLKTHHEVTIPHALDCLERNGHVTNFDKAAGTFDGPLRGHHAFDSDIHKAMEGAMYSLQEHQMYNAGHFFEMAVEHQRLTGQSKATDAARRFADHIDSVFGPGKRYDVGGHEEIELALVKLYRATGERRYLELARFLLDERGHLHGAARKPFEFGPLAVPERVEGQTDQEYRRARWHASLRWRNGRMQDHKPLIEQTEAVGHAVRAGYIYAAMADIARFMDAGEYERAVDSLWRDVVEMNDPKDYNGGKGNLAYVMANSPLASMYTHLKDAGGKWTVRDDVWVRYKTPNQGLLTGGLTIGYTGYGHGSHIGPELQFGHVVGDFYDNQVMLIKTAWGGKSLFADFRPPSSGGQVGPYYTRMLMEVQEALDNLNNDFPSNDGGGYEIAGFIWMQGWNDMCNPQAIPEYDKNLVNLMKDLRAEFQSPELPVVISELGNGGPEARGNMAAFRKAQQIDNAAFVITHDFWRDPQESPNVNHGHHWCGNAESYFLIGNALGEGMIELIEGGGSKNDDPPAFTAGSTGACDSEAVIRRWR